MVKVGKGWAEEVGVEGRRREEGEEERVVMWSFVEWSVISGFGFPKGKAAKTFFAFIFRDEEEAGASMGREGVMGAGVGVGVGLRGGEGWREGEVEGG